jgi:hypothetical protein
VEKEEEEEVLKCFYRTVRAVKIERTSGADFSAAKRFHGRFVVFSFSLLCTHKFYAHSHTRRYFCLSASGLEKGKKTPRKN